MFVLLEISPEELELHQDESKDELVLDLECVNETVNKMDDGGDDEHRHGMYVHEQEKT